MNTRGRVEEQEADLARMRAEKARLLDSMFQAMRLISNGTDTLLKASGFASRDAGVVHVFRETDRRVAELSRAFFKKWPD